MLGELQQRLHEQDQTKAMPKINKVVQKWGMKEIPVQSSNTMMNKKHKQSRNGFTNHAESQFSFVLSGFFQVNHLAKLLQSLRCQQLHILDFFCPL